MPLEFAHEVSVELGGIALLLLPMCYISNSPLDLEILSLQRQQSAHPTVHSSKGCQIQHQPWSLCCSARKQNKKGRETGKLRPWRKRENGRFREEGRIVHCMQQR